MEYFACLSLDGVFDIVAFRGPLDLGRFDELSDHATTSSWFAGSVVGLGEIREGLVRDS